MKKNIIIILFLLYSVSAYSQWNPEFSSTLYDLNSVFFVDINNGWTVGYSGTILNTTNGGSTWFFQNSDSTTNLQSVYFISDSTGWIVGENGTMLKTTNGGTNWLAQNSQTLSELHKVFFINENYGWAVGSSGTIRKTTNGGTDWLSVYNSNTNYLFSIFFIDSLNGWMCGGGGKILRTTNGGSNWSVLYSNPNLINISDIYFADADSGWAVSDFNGTILKTTNGGIDWAVQYIAGRGLTSVHFINTDTGWVAGEGGIIFKTANSGIDWTSEASGSLNDLQSLSLIDENNGWTAGANGTMLAYSPNTITAPVLISPEFNASDVMVPTVFEWGSVAGATSYNLQISTTINFSKILVNQKNITSQTFASLILQNSSLYYWRVSASDQSGVGSWSSVWSFTTNNYCSASVKYCSSYTTEFISNVKFNTINKASDCPPSVGYSNFIDQATNLVKGNTYPITVTVTNPTSSDVVAAYIDWNQNLILNDSNEVYILTPTNGGATWTDSITVPMDVPEGYTRLRVRLFDSLPMNPCETTIFLKGDVEEYSINVIPSISIEPIRQTLYCSGDELIIPFTVKNISLKSNNVFSAWLNTVPPKLIGTVSGTTTGKYSIVYIISDSIPSGSGYQVYITSSNPACRSLNSNNFGINKFPQVFTVFGDSTACYRDFGVTIKLNGSQIGFDYQLVNDLVSVGSPQHGTGDTLTFNDVRDEGSHTIYAYNPNTLCSKKMDSSVNVIIYPLPSVFNLVSLQNPHYCMGSQSGVDLVLNVSTQDFIYQLYFEGNLINSLTGTGDSLFFGNYSEPGTYNVIAVNPLTLCRISMDSSINVKIFPMPNLFNIVSLGGGHYCESSLGVDITLANSEIGKNYELFYDGTLYMTYSGTGGLISTILPFPEGIYTMRAVDTVSLCETWSLDTVFIKIDSLTLIQNATPVDSNISINPTNFNWTPALCASDYHLIISANSDLTFPVIEYTYSASGLSLPLKFYGLRMDTTYYWQVSSIYNLDTMASPIFSFKTAPPLPQQTIALNHGWNMISTNLIPQFDSMPVIWKNKTDSLLIIKDGSGKYWMPPSSGTLNYWNVLNGYLAYMTQPDTLIITGNHVPQTDSISFPLQGWYLISYLPQTPMQASQALSSIIDNLVLLKNGSGEFYFPMFGINTLEKSSGMMVPGRGYFIFVLKPCTLVYPGN